MVPRADTLREPGAGAALAWSCATGAALAVVALLVRRFVPGILDHLPKGAAGAGLLVAAGAGLTAAGAPRQVVAFAGGFGFGAALGTGLALASQLLGCALDYAAAATAALPWAERRLGPRWMKIRGFLQAHPFRATLTLRLLPVGNNMLLNVAAGALGVRPGAFFAASALGYLPQTVIFALLGSGVQLGQGTKIAVAAALFAASASLGLTLARK